MTTVSKAVSSVTTLSGTPVLVGGSMVDALNDGTDDTFIFYSNGTSQEASRIAFEDFVLPTGALVISMAVNVRVFGQSLEYTPTYAAYNNRTNPSSYVPSGTTWGYQSSATIPNLQRVDRSIFAEFGGLGASIASVNDMCLYIGNYSSGGNVHTVWLYEAQASLTYNEVPVVTVTAPVGNKFTNKPLIKWDFVDPEGTLQRTYRAKIFSAAQYGAGGFNPETSTSTWDSGDVLSSLWMASVTTALADGAYRAYVKAEDSFSSDPTSGRNLYSSWAYSDFTVITSLPNLPTLTTPVVDQNNKSIAFNFKGHDNLLTVNASSIETDATAWTTSFATNLSRTTAQAAHGSGALQLSPATTEFAQAETVTHYPVVPGYSYSGRAFMRAAATARSWKVRVKWYNAAGTLLGTAIGGTTAITTSGWTELTVTTAIAPGTAASAALEIISDLQLPASEVHYADKLMLALGTLAETPWNIGGYGATGIAEVLRSNDAGTTWTPLRAANGFDTFLPLQNLDIVDYEGPLGLATIYKARMAAEPEEDEFVYSAYTANTASNTLTATDDWWLKDTGVPANNMKFAVLDRHDISIKGQDTAYYVLARKFPVVVSDVSGGEDGQIIYDVQTKIEWTAAKKILSSANTLLLQAPTGDQWYIHIMDDRPSTMYNTDLSAPYRTGTLSYVEVDSGII